MADPRWKAKLRRVQQKVVPLISGLLNGSLLDALLAKNLLSDEDYESVRTMRKQSDTEAARELISLLKKKPPPAFDTFCQTLREIDGAVSARAILNELQVALAQDAATELAAGGDGGDTEDVGETSQPSNSSTVDAHRRSIPNRLPRNEAERTGAEVENADEGCFPDVEPDVIVIKHLSRSCLRLSGEKVELKQIDQDSCLITNEGDNLLMLRRANISVEVPSGAIRPGSEEFITVSLLVAETTVNITDSAMKLEEAVASITLFELLPHHTQFDKEIILRQQLSRHEMTDNPCCIGTRFLFYYWGGDTDSPKYEFMGTVDSSRSSVRYRDKTIGITQAMGQAASAPDDARRQHCLMHLKSFCYICRVKVSHCYNNTLMVFGRQNQFLSVYIEAVLTCQCKALVKKIQNEERKKRYFLLINPWRFSMENHGGLQRRCISIKCPTKQMELDEDLFFLGSDVVSIQLSEADDTSPNKTALLTGIREDADMIVKLRASCASHASTGFYFEVRSGRIDLTGQQEIEQASHEGNESDHVGPDLPEQERSYRSDRFGDGEPGAGQPKHGRETSTQEDKSLYSELASKKPLLVEKYQRFLSITRPEESSKEEDHKIVRNPLSQMKKLFMELTKAHFVMQNFKRPLKSCITSATFINVQSFVKITKNPEFENETSAFTSAIDTLECEWNNDNLAEKFISFPDSTQAIKETAIFLEIFCRLLSLKKIARKLEIEKEIKDFSAKEQLVYCLQSHFEGCSTQAVQLLVKAAKMAGYIYADRRPTDRELVMVFESVHKKWPAVVYRLGLEKAIDLTKKSHEDFTKLKQAYYAAYTAVYKTCAESITLSDVRMVIENECGNCSSNVLQECKLGWLLYSAGPARQLPD